MTILTCVHLLLVLLSAAPAGEESASSDCGECHLQILEQWLSSTHSRSTPFSDPVHGAMYRRLVGDPSEEGRTQNGAYPVCIACHVPAAALDRRTRRARILCVFH